jgi:hypothetical protein
MTSSQTGLRNALVMLSLPPAEQQRLNGPGCLTCDMPEDYLLAWRVAQEDPAIQFTPEQSRVLQEISQAVDALTEEDYECFSLEAVSRPAWQAIREQAIAALLLFGWQDATVEPFTETSPSVWTRPVPTE